MTTGFYNPKPIILEETNKIENDFLSAQKLSDISGCNDLKEVKTIEMVINTRDTTVGNFGKYLPALERLNLNGSIVPSIRDIGTSFYSLVTLCMANCQLVDVNGIATIQNLRELHLADNHIGDISPISFLDSLEVLDVKNNLIADVEQIDYLSFSSNLEVLNLQENPVCSAWKGNESLSLKSHILSIVPGLKRFNGDACSFSAPAMNSTDALPASEVKLHTGADVIVEKKNDDIMSESAASKTYLQLNVTSGKEAADHDYIELHSPRLKSKFSAEPLPSRTARKSDADLNSTKKSFNLSKESVFKADDASFLTFGAPLSGNPMQALRERKNLPPSIAMLSVKEENTARIQPQRPSTAAGLRRRVRMISEEQMMLLQSNFKKDISPQDTSDHSSTSSNNFIIPSPPRKKTSHDLPTPPQSQQRPKTSQGFRSKRFRRPFTPRPSQSMDITSRANVGVQHRLHTIAASMDDAV